MNRTKIILAVFCVCAIAIACGGGGGGDDDEDLTPPPNPGTGLDLQGYWSLNLVNTTDDCPGGQLLAGVDQQVYGVAQDGVVISVNYARICQAGAFEEGTVTDDGFRSEYRRTIACAGGGQTTEISATEFSSVENDIVSSVTHTYQYGCPQAYCYRKWEGEGTRFSHTRPQCSTLPQPTATGATASPTGSGSATPTPTNWGQLQRCECNVTACCTNHGGVHGCLSDGTVICNDDSASTCRCPASS